VPVPEGINEAALKAAVVDHTSFEDLPEISCRLDLFLENTKQMAQDGCDEEWRMQYDVLDNLRVLNKHNPSELQLAHFTRFISDQVDNLRSNNSRNALTLVYEIFSRPGVKQQMMALFVNDILPIVLNKTASEKSFISSVAKRAVSSAAEAIPKHVTCNVLLSGVDSKNISLAEFSIHSIWVLVQKTDI
jgi:hypothetical protein